MSVNVAPNNGNQRGSFLGAVKDSAVNVLSTAAVGGVVGGIGGKIATIAPYKPSVEALNFQYADMFEKAATATEIPAFLQDKGDDIVQLTKKGQKTLKGFNGLKGAMGGVETMYATLSKVPEDKFGSEDVQKIVKAFFKNDKKVPEGGYTKTAVLERLKGRFDTMGGILKNKGEEFMQAQGSFVEKIKGLKNAQIDDWAAKGAKHLRNRAMIGAGVGLGIVGALVLNLLSTSGLFNKKQPANAQKQAVQSHQG